MWIEHETIVDFCYYFNRVCIKTPTKIEIACSVLQTIFRLLSMVDTFYTG